ncbi:MAG: OsmC family protein [Rhodoplanes sp.]|uniref:OsmC family protein n=1 Tax=Rhodoplanes sp. TaxID=1968906 RepID=UPI001854557C|nr:OsmC family protein [Rhodoplanes sp.]NVO16087.1 OsmC family protein [Rhodoplanes sp.]
MTSTKTHTYVVHVTWTGNTGRGTAGYKGYDRSFVMRAGDKPEIAGSSDPAFRGDAARWNPEDLLVASLSACHKLWYLHLCAEAGIVVTAYDDDAEGSMVEDSSRGGFFTGVRLRPLVTITATSDAARARALHEEAHRLCFIANSVNFPVTCEPTIGMDEN